MKSTPEAQTRRFLSVFGLACLAMTFAPNAHSQPATEDRKSEGDKSSEAPKPPADPIARIREEGLKNSQAMKTLSHLTDVIGPRLTGSPNLKKANDWTREQLDSWGVSNAHLEAWGPFGRGWSVRRFSAQVIEPQTIPLIGYPNAWSPGFDQPLIAEVVHFDAGTNSDFEPYKGKLAGAIVLSGPLRELKAPFEPLAVRMTVTNLLQLANAGEATPIPASLYPAYGVPGSTRQLGRGAGPRRGPPGDLASRDDAAGTNSTRGESRSRLAGEVGRDREETGTNSTGGGFAGGDRPRPRFQSNARALSFIAKEGAALIVNPSTRGEGGTVFVAGASVPGPGNGRPGGAGGPGGFTNGPRAWATNAPTIPPQITIALEDYNRMVRMIQQGEHLKMAVDLQVKFYDDDLMAYNTVAEIPGTDLKDQVVMLGAHLDSWHSGTGATDNGVGVAATMEAMRILSVLKLQPRRTIRIGLWSGEEQGMFGSKAYVAEHFGYYTNASGRGASAALRGEGRDASRASALLRQTEETDGENKDKATPPPGTNSPPRRQLVRQRDYEKLSAYFNLDNGAGKIRGVHLQGNEAVRPLFRRWLTPLADLGAETITFSNTGSTDHMSFDAIGLPGFQFIQDPLDYSSRTHHSNQDVFDRIQADDLKQAAIVLATFAYDAAMLDEPLPRKPLEEPGSGRRIE